MPLISDVVKVWKVLGKVSLVLSLLQDVLTLVPIPRLVNFPKILNNQRITLDTVGFLTENSKTFGVDPKVGVYFVSELANSFKNNLSQVLIVFSTLCLVIQNVLQGLRYIVAHRSLLLDCKQELLLDKV